MKIYIRGLDTSPLLRECRKKKSLFELKSDALLECLALSQGEEFSEKEGVFEISSPQTEKNQAKTEKDATTNCKTIAFDKQNALKNSLVFEKNQKCGGELPKKEETVAEVVKRLGNFYENYIKSAKNIGKQVERLASSLLIYDFFAEIFGTTPPPFLKTEKGKPYFDDKRVDFSISHSNALVCVAFSVPREKTSLSLGLDAEKVEKDTDCERLKKIAERFFSAREAEQLSFLKGDAFHKSFTRIWTEKESLAKMDGEGLPMTSMQEKTSYTQKTYSLFLEGEQYFITVSARTRK